MDPNIIVALIAAGGGLIGTVIGIRMNTSLVLYRLGQLEKKVERHNQVMERTYNLESNDKVQDEKFANMERRISKIERAK